MGNTVTTETTEGAIEFNENITNVADLEEESDDESSINGEENGTSEGEIDTDVDDLAHDLETALSTNEFEREEVEDGASRYKDTAFPPKMSSLCYSRKAERKWENKIEWKRIHEISENPRLLKDDVSSDDIIQGMLGDCWFLAACAAISRHPRLMRKIIPLGQESDNKTGIYRFRFWRFGNWIEVVVDDYLPTFDNKPAFGHSSDSDEFWLPLLEKAYAKLHGSYEAIVAGQPDDSLEDLTGGMARSYQFGEKTPPDLFLKVSKALKNGSFVCASITNLRSSIAKRTGLIAAHAYTVTGGRKISFLDSEVELIRVRNPWGNKTEWTGDWSDESDLWDKVDPETRKNLEYADKDDGEWWMTFDDFAKYFDSVTICTLGPDFDKDGVQTGDKWLLNKTKDVWITGKNAGGSRNDHTRYISNPQYHLHLKESDAFDPDDREGEGKTSIVIGLMQEGRRAGKKKGMKNLNMRVDVFKVDEKPPKKLEDYFRYHLSTVHSGNYTNKREVHVTAQLEPGNYVIVPSTFYPDKSGSFLVRIFTEGQVDLEELI